MAKIRPALDYDLSLTRDKMNAPLNENATELIKLMIDHPSAKIWNLTYRVIVACPKPGVSITIWRAVCAVDKSFQKTVGPAGVDGKPTWDRIPTSQTLIDALRWATH